MASSQLGIIDGQADMEWSESIWHFDEDDWLVMAMLMDPVYMSELLFQDPKNKQYAGCYHVMDYQYPLFRPTQNYQGYPCARSVGKAQPLDAPILTPDGWREMGDLQPGDSVIGGDGRPTAIIGVYPQGERDIYAVEFSDGDVVECDIDHLWSVTCDTWKRRGVGPRTLPLREIMERRAVFKTPLIAGPVEFRPRPTPPIDPWLLGALIGDGNLTRPTMIRFSSADAEVVERVRASIGHDAELVHDNAYDYRVRTREASYTRAGNRRPPKLLEAARTLGLQGKGSHQKSIPPDYLYGSPRVRLDVLRGLVDTDGSVTHAGSVEISTASEALSDDVAFIVRSLGGRASVRRGPTTGRDRFRVVFSFPTADVVPCYLTRKANQYNERNGNRVRHTAWRAIKEARFSRRARAQCIEVAAPDGLYVTSGMVVTHNTESIKARAVCHAFRRQGEDLLLTAPELIHLLPLTDAIESRISDTHLTAEFLDRQGGKTGFTHKPFQCDFLDGTKIVGRIPKITGTGVKGQHVPDLIVEEAQDYPEKGWIEVHETVIKDHMDSTGEYDFTYHFYGVHSGARDGRFYRLSTSGEFKITAITALMRPGWNPEEKRRAAAMYGGTTAPDYRRNILGEAGGVSSPFFVTSRLMACLDQDRESRYNTVEFKRQRLLAEEVDKVLAVENEVTTQEDSRDVGHLLDLPDPEPYQQIFAGMDIGLVNDPTVITVWAVTQDARKKSRLQLIRLFEVERFREKQIRQLAYRIGWHFGARLRAFGFDVTGLGLPIFQAMEDDERAPQHLLDAARDYVFSAKYPIGVDETMVSRDSHGMLRDQYGSMVRLEVDPITRIERYVVYMSMIEASTRYLRQWVDSGYLMLPFQPDVVGDMQGETEQRVRAMSGMKKKPNAFHILDSMRAMAMAQMAADVEAQVAVSQQTPVLARAVEISATGLYA